jgi:putative oxidoreductase
MRWILLIGRVIFGGYFIFAGLNHFMHMQQLAAYAAPHGVPAFMIPVTGLMLIVGGSEVVLGLVPRFGLVLLLAFLIPVSFTMHAFWADTDPAMKAANAVNFTKNMGLVGACVGWIAHRTPWPLSLDEAILHNRTRIRAAS